MRKSVGHLSECAGRTQCCRCKATSGCVASGLDHADLVFSITQAYPHLFLFGHRAFRQKESWTLMASYGAERVKKYSTNL